MIFFNILRNYTNYIKYLKSNAPKISAGCLFSIALVEYIWSLIPDSRMENKIAQYWQQQPVTNVLEEADNNLKNEEFMKVYEMLNRLKYSREIGAIWRTVKALYNLSLNPDLSVDVRKAMIQESYEILMNASAVGEGKAYYHKWLAIILNAKNGLESLESRVIGYPEVRDHLKLACQNNPKDFTIQHILGKWHYEMANLTWFQRLLARYLFEEPPKSNFQEAYKHLNKAEELLPRTYLPNVFLLGCVCIQLGQYYRAKYYLNMAINLPTHSDCDKCCSTSAKRLLAKLEKYDLGKDLLYESYHNFGFTS